MNTMKFFLSVIILTCAHALSAQSKLVKAYVTKVYDGDGCRAVLPDGKVHKLRFANIDAPELKNSYVDITETQPYGFASRDSLRKLILGDTILVDLQPFTKLKTSYDRDVVDVYTLDTVLINQIIVAKGWAWYTKGYNPRQNKDIDTNMNEAHQLAKTAKLGLFGIKGKKVTPSVWRGTHKSVK